MSDPNTDKPRPAKPNPLEEGAVRVRKLLFNATGGVDLPTEQRRASITESPRADGPNYRIMFLPRIDKFLVRAYMPGKPDAAPTHTFMIPGDWAVAEFAEQ